MTIPREAIEKVVEAHPDTALVGVPVSLLRELLRALPVATLPLAVLPSPLMRGFDGARGSDMSVTEVRATV